MTHRLKAPDVAKTSRRGFFKGSAALAGTAWACGPGMADVADDPSGLRVGAAAAELEADDSMVIAGGIHPRFVKGQEGELRAVAIVIEKPARGRLAIVSCDVLMMTRDQLDPVLAEIESACGIPASNVLLHCTHTHHAPSTCRVHGYDRDGVFSQRVQRAILAAVKGASANLVEAAFHFKLGEERTVGQNSRLLMKDGSIHWIGPRDDAVRPTGPFDPDLPVLCFRDRQGRNLALIFNHSTHTIGAVKGNLRSPAFYGLAAQQLESELGGTVCFLEGASGSTHRLDVAPAEAMERIKKAVLNAIGQAQEQEVQRLVAVRRSFEFKVRTFDEEAEERAVSDYCRKRAGGSAESTIAVFREMRRQLAPHQGEVRTTWLQAMAVGDVAIVGIPAEFFTCLGMELKRRSPMKHTLVAELANDWIGYVGDREAHRLGGYQMWMGLHSYAEPGTGERMVEESVAMLEELCSDGAVS